VNEAFIVEDKDMVGVVMNEWYWEVEVPLRGIDLGIGMS